MSQRKETEEKPASRARHEAGCRICAHPEREEIERDWIGWGNTTRIAAEYGLSRDFVYRHAHAFGLFAKRKANVAKALECILERSESVDVTAAAVVAAAQALAKINADGKWVDRVERIDLNSLFTRMTHDELEKYAREGTLPDWFEETTGATGLDEEE